MAAITMMPTVAETIAANPGIRFNLAPAELQTIDWYCDTVQFDPWYADYTVDAIGEPDADGTVTIFCHADKMPADNNTETEGELNMTNWITMESFGDNLPENWEEIAAMLNAKLEAAGVPEYGEMTPDEQDAAAQIWEDWCNG